MENEMNLYEYAVIRYLPRVEREEFVNVGLIMMCKRRKWVKVRVMVPEGKLAVYDCAHSKEEIERGLETFVKVGMGDRSGGPMAERAAEERCRWLPAVTSACLETSRPHPGKCEDLEGTFERLFAALVE